jgi:hypothetical protein
MDRSDRVEPRRIRAGEIAQGRPEPRLSRLELERESEREKAAKTTPATQADLSRIEAALTQVKSALHAATGRKSARRSDSGGEYFRYGGNVTGGRTDMHAPPSPTAWRIDGELRGGHSIAETLLWAAWSAITKTSTTRVARCRWV